jgi:hypothetical protein
MNLTKTPLIVIALFSLTLLWIGGCSDDVTQSVPEGEETLNLTDTYGGYTPTSEAPGFGDSEILALEGSEPAEDPLARSPLIDSLNRLENVDVYSLELLWGQLEFDSTVTEITDWSGSLAVERGAVIAARLICFDHGDHLVRPRGRPRMLEWKSQTAPHYDGILVFIYDPQPDSFDTENTVTFTTEPYSRTFTMSELVSIEEIVDVGDNQVSITAFLSEPLECGKGFMAGRWHRHPHGDKGRFHGHWISADGYILGHLKGHYGTRDDGEQVMFGKWIGIGGAFRGLLRGHWGYEDGTEDPERCCGWFDGRWDNAAGTKLGSYEGKWFASPPPPRDGEGPQGNGQGNAHGRGGKGEFRGHWWEICDEE